MHSINTKREHISFAEKSEASVVRDALLFIDKTKKAPSRMTGSSLKGPNGKGLFYDYQMKFTHIRVNPHGGVNLVSNIDSIKNLRRLKPNGV